MIVSEKKWAEKCKKGPDGTVGHFVKLTTEDDSQHPGNWLSKTKETGPVTLDLNRCTNPKGQ